MARILIVEDNPANLKLAEAILQHQDHQTLSAVRGDDGLELARRELPDLILMDVQMPGLNGLEATRQLKQDPRTSAIPIVGLTAFAMKGDEQRILAVGCNAYLAKPYGHAQLTELVARLLASA